MVRLFISSCRRLWIVQENNTSSKKPKFGDKRKDTDWTSRKTNEKFEPFYVTKANFLSLLNVGDMIEEAGSMRKCFEVENESYIQNVKREISTI